jgi:hypothetical protein
MAAVLVPGYQAFWADKRASLEADYNTLIGKYPDADTQYGQLYSTLCTIEDVAGYTPAVVGESAEWTAIVRSAEENRVCYCKALTGRTLFIALCGTYTVNLKELKSLLKASTTAGRTTTSTETEKPTEGEAFKEVRRRKRHSTNEAAPTSKKPAAEAKSTPSKEVSTRNFFAPLRAKMDTDSSVTEATTPEETVPGKAGRPSPIILTSVISEVFMLCGVVTVTLRVLSWFVVTKRYSYNKIVLQLIDFPPGEYPINRFI